MNLFDNLKNFITGLGTSADPGTHTQFVPQFLSMETLEAMYRGDWIAAKVVDIPADDSTREWRNWQAKQNQIELLEAVERRLNVQEVVREGMSQGRLYGDALIVMGIDDGKFPNLPVDLETLRADCLKFLHVLAWDEMTKGPIIKDPLDPYFGQPSYYERHYDSLVGADANPAVQALITQRIHPSRVIRMSGRKLSSRARRSTAHQGHDSVLQSCYDAIRAAATVQGGIAALIHDAKFDVVKVPDLTNKVSNAKWAARLTQRFIYANQTKSILNSIVVDKEEDWERIQTNFGGLPDILQMYLLVMSGAADIPATRFLGQSPAGLSSTGESDLRNYYDRIKADQNRVLAPAIAQLDDVIIRSALGARDPSIYYMWAPLWQLDETAKATIQKSKVDMFKVDYDMGLIPKVALVKARITGLIEDGAMPGLEQAIEALGGIDAVAEEMQAEIEASRIEEQAMLAEQGMREQGAVEAEAAKPKVELKVVEGGKKKAIGDQRLVDDLVAIAQAGRTPILDTRPRSLYVRRDVLNGEEILKWARKVGFKSLIDAKDLHVTIMYSRAPVDWIKAGNDESVYYSTTTGKDRFFINEGGPRVVEQFGEKYTVLAFASDKLAWRHRRLKDIGCESDYDEYNPHISLSKEPQDFDLNLVIPYRGKIELGPEIFEEVKDKGDLRKRIGE